MNCQEVEIIITDLARNQAPQGEAEAAAAHLKQCRRCSDRLSAEQGLTYELLVWNAACLQEQAPLRVEESVRAAFRSNLPRARRPWLKFAVGGSIAAGLLLFRVLTSAPAPKVEAPVASVVAPPPAPLVEVVEAPPLVQPTRVLKKKRQATSLSHAELGTEFLPVAQGDGWTPLDGGRLVRVGLPRSAMGAFGLPVNEGLAPERVQADVVLSDDGLLRAIRFVK